MSKDHRKPTMKDLRDAYHTGFINGRQSNEAMIMRLTMENGNLVKQIDQLKERPKCQ